jgi:molecular chaperone DnaK
MIRPIGIDFGTTNSLVAAPTGDGMELLPGADGRYLTPSVVSLKQGDALVGREAANRAVKEPDATVWSPKRAIGTDTQYELANETYTPVEIASLIIQKLCSNAEQVLGEAPTKGVLTVPARFSPAQRGAVKHAGELAGLDVQRLLPEPTAACLAHGLRTSEERPILVLDLGGGTFDVSLVEVSDNVFEVVRTTGTQELGGDDWDGAVVEWAIDRLESKHGVTFDPETSPVATQQLFDAVQAAKERLADSRKTSIEVPYLHHDAIQRVELPLSRRRFQSLTAGLREELFSHVEEVVKLEGLDRYSRRADVVLVGGATRMPQVHDGLEDRFGLSPVQDADPDTTVALGAAAQAQIVDDVDLVARGSKRTSLSTPSQEPEPPTQKAETTSLVPTHSNPDSLLLVDTVPETIGAVSDPASRLHKVLPIIEKGQAIPCEGTLTFNTNRRNYRRILIQITQGNPDEDIEDILIDEFKLNSVDPHDVKESELDITAEIDADGLLTITVEQEESDVYNEVVLSGVLGVSSGKGSGGEELELEDHREGLPTVK